MTLIVSITNILQKVFCIYCKHAKKHELFTFSKCGEKTFTDSGFQNWKKVVAKFKDHDSSHCYQEAKLNWIAQEQPIDAILKDYNVLLEILEEIHDTTKDEYGLKVFGLMQLLENFGTLFGLKLSYQLFSASEQVSLTLQKKKLQFMMHYLL